MSSTKEYSNGEVTIVWKPDLCIHSANCVKGLPNVFDVKKRPWINADGASTEQIINQVKKCPSGALSTYMNKNNQIKDSSPEVKITLAENGPLLINGTISIQDSQGTSFNTGTTTALCRCGGSANKPFCDGSHVKAGFKG